jgi:thymidylate synthase (FAD)
MEVKLKTITPQIEKNIVEIARVSSSRTDKSEDLSKLINYLIKNKHWSPFEHGFFTVEIKTSKAIGIQLLRHRSFTFQEFSQRYAIVENLEPIELRKQASDNRQSSTDIFNPKVYYPGYNSEILANSAIENYLKQGQDLYKELLNKGVARECARMILPMCTETTIFMTGSIRSWIHFIQIRDDEHAQLEIRLIAKEIKSIFIKELPIISKALDY